MDNQSPDYKPQTPGRALKARESLLATATGGMAIALSTVLSMIPLYKMPQGGSVTPASLLPLLLCAFAFGPAWGIGIGAVYGILQFIISPFAAHWASIFLDYPLAFAMIGLAGLFSAPRSRRFAEKSFLRRIALRPLPLLIIGMVVGVFGRFLCSFFSGIIFYASYAPEGQNVWIYSLGYNGTYLLPELAILIIVLIPLYLAVRPRRPLTA